MFSPVKRAKTPQKGRKDHEISNQLSPSPCREIEQRATDAYRARFGESPQVMTSAPGRVDPARQAYRLQRRLRAPCTMRYRAPRRGSPWAMRHGGLYSVDSRRRPAARTDARRRSWTDYSARRRLAALEQTGARVPSVSGGNHG